MSFRSALSLLLCSFVSLAAAASDGYLGAESCAGCHEQAYSDWQASDHFKAMQRPTKDSVLGDFNNVEVNFHGISSRLFQREGDYFIDTANRTGDSQTFKIDYTFGFSPLQQYLVTLEDGRVQALNIAWDSRSKSDGGQRWFHLQPDEDIDPEHPFFWTGHFNNWNSNCANCHSTNLQKNYSQESNSYATTWGDINVACESCHGPAEKHVGLANSGQLSAAKNGFETFKTAGVQWRFTPGDSIANPVQDVENSAGGMVAGVDEINACGSCHSRRMTLAPGKPSDDYHDKHRLRLLDEGLYFPDGQIQDEVFVLGSFLQSKMHEQGVTCSNCHNPHSGKLIAQGNAVCSQCHQSDVFDQAKHHQHPQGSEGAQCVSCHMPERTYMGVDERRDHSFSVPNLSTHKDLETPLACAKCHDDKDTAWVKKSSALWDNWPKQADSYSQHWGSVNAAARRGDRLVSKTLTTVIGGQADIIAATLLQQLADFPSRLSVETAQKQLQSDSPLLRRAAVTSLAGVASQTRWQLLASMMSDSHLSVRHEVAVQLMDASPLVPAEERVAYQRLMDEYLDTLLHTQDTPSGQLSLAQFYSRQGGPNNQGSHSAALKAYKNALRFGPSYVPTLINFADFNRQIGRDAEARVLLDKALKIAPDSAGVQHSYGLMLIREAQYAQALPYLKEAFELPTGQPRYAYVYAIALDNQRQLKEAIAVLETANKRWPNQTDLLLTLVRYLEKNNEINKAYRYLSDLSRIAPGSPQVSQILERLQAR